MNNFTSADYLVIMEVIMITIGFMDLYYTWKIQRDVYGKIDELKEGMLLMAKRLPSNERFK
jgi:hypothetical protein